MKLVRFNKMNFPVQKTESAVQKNGSSVQFLEPRFKKMDRLPDLHCTCIAVGEAGVEILCEKIPFKVPMNLKFLPIRVWMNFIFGKIRFIA